MTYYVRWCVYCKSVRSWHPFTEQIRVMVCDTCHRDEKGQDCIAIAKKIVEADDEDRKIVEGDPSAPLPKGLLHAPRQT